MVWFDFWKLSDVAVQPAYSDSGSFNDASYGLQRTVCKGPRCWDTFIIEEKEIGRTVTIDTDSAFTSPEQNRDAVPAYLAAKSESDEQYLKDRKVAAKVSRP